MRERFACAEAVTLEKSLNTEFLNATEMYTVHFSNLVSVRTTSILWACPTSDPKMPDLRCSDLFDVHFLGGADRLSGASIEGGEQVSSVVKRKVSLQSGYWTPWVLSFLLGVRLFRASDKLICKLARELKG